MWRTIRWPGAKIYFLQVKGSHRNAKICSKGNKNKGRRSPPVQFTVGSNTKTQTGESFKQKAVWLCEGGEEKIWRLPSTSCPTPSRSILQTADPRNPTHSMISNNKKSIWQHIDKMILYKDWPRGILSGHGTVQILVVVTWLYMFVYIHGTVHQKEWILLYAIFKSK